MKPVFHDHFISDKIDPLAQSYTDFDLQSVENALGEVHPIANEELKAECTIIVRAILDFAVGNIDLRRHDAMCLMGRRFAALAWVVDPSLFAGSPTAGCLADSFKIDRKTFYKITKEVIDRFGISNRLQAHAVNRRAHLAQKHISQATSHQSKSIKQVEQDNSKLKGEENDCK